MWISYIPIENIFGVKKIIHGNSKKETNCSYVQQLGWLLRVSWQVKKDNFEKVYFLLDSVYLPFLKWEHDRKEQLRRCQGLRRKWGLGGKDVCPQKSNERDPCDGNFCLDCYLHPHPSCDAMLKCHNILPLGGTEWRAHCFLFGFYNNCMRTYSNLTFKMFN